MISRILGVTRHILGRSWCKTVLTCCVFYIGRKVSGKSLWGKSPRKSPKEKIEEKSPLANCSGKFPQENFLGKSIGKFIGTFLGKIVGKLLRKSLGKIHRGGIFFRGRQTSRFKNLLGRHRPRKVSQGEGREEVLARKGGVIFFRGRQRSRFKNLLGRHRPKKKAKGRREKRSRPGCS